MDILRRTRKGRFAALATTGALGIAGMGIGVPAASAQPVVTGGLVNVTIVDFADVNLEDIVVQVPVAAAANICDVNAAVLLAAIEDTGSADCDATATSRAGNNRPG